MKSVSATEAGVGDTLTYTVRIQNSGTVTATNVSFLDPIPVGTTFVANSVTINGTPQPGLNPTTGFPLANIPVGGMVTVTFKRQSRVYHQIEFFRIMRMSLLISK